MAAGKPPPGPRDFWGALYETRPPDGAEKALSAIEKFTGFPEPLFAASERRLTKWHAARNHLIMREDLRDLTRIRELGLIENLVALLPERIGSPLSLNSLAGDLAVAFHTAQAWVNALSRLYYLFIPRPYSGKLARAIRKEGKAYLFDATDIRESGAKFENIAALHFSKLCGLWTDMGYGDYELRYVRDREKREVDFLITADGMPYALIEAKLSDTVIAPGLRYFKERLKPGHTIQIVRHASQIRREPGITVIPAAWMFALI